MVAQLIYQWWSDPNRHPIKKTFLKYTDPFYRPLALTGCGFLLGSTITTSTIAIPAITKYGGSRPSSQVLEQFRRLVFPVNVGYSYILMFTGLAAWRASSLQSSETGRGAWSATAGVLGVSAGHELYRMYAKTGGLVIHGRKENITAEEVKQGMKEWMRWHRIRIGLTGMASMVALYAMAGEWGKWGKFADEEKKNEELVVKWPFQKSDKS